MAADSLVRVSELAERVRWRGRGNPYVDWPAVEKDLGRELPADYKELVTRFPRGLFQDYLTLSVPEAENGRLSIIANYEPRLEDYRQWRDDEPSNFPYPLHPEPGGLIPWAGSVLAETFFWLPVGADPASWDVVAVDASNTRWQRFSMGTVDFIKALVTGELDSEFLLRTSEEPTFAPFA